MAEDLLEAYVIKISVELLAIVDTSRYLCTYLTPIILPYQYRIPQQQNEKKIKKHGP
jgi:hypothetical protein